jgi:hypothetical protein
VPWRVRRGSVRWGCVRRAVSGGCGERAGVEPGPQVYINLGRCGERVVHGCRKWCAGVVWDGRARARTDRRDDVARARARAEWPPLGLWEPWLSEAGADAVAGEQWWVGIDCRGA